MLFPEARQALDHAAGDTPVSTPGYDVDAAREQARALAAAEPREDVAEVLDVVAGGADAAGSADGVPCRPYVPAPASPGSGVVLHLHGGGFVFNDVEVHDAAARRLANRTGHRVLSIDYRLAPEHPFPAAPDDVDTVLAWLAAEGPGLGLDGPTYGHGDSAGANLALVAALRHPGRFAALALVYPFLDPTRGFASHDTETEGFEPADVDYYWRAYSGGDDTAYDDPDLAPLRSAALHTLPPTLVVTAEHDPLRDEGEHLARLLAQQGVTVTATRYLGQVHGFWRHDRVFPSAEPLMLQVAAFLASYAAAARG